MSHPDPAQRSPGVVRTNIRSLTLARLCLTSRDREGAVAEQQGARHTQRSNPRPRSPTSPGVVCTNNRSLTVASRNTNALANLMLALTHPDPAQRSPAVVRTNTRSLTLARLCLTSRDREGAVAEQQGARHTQRSNPRPRSPTSPGVVCTNNRSLTGL